MTCSVVFEGGVKRCPIFWQSPFMYSHTVGPTAVKFSMLIHGGGEANTQTFRTPYKLISFDHLTKFISNFEANQGISRQTNRYTNTVTGQLNKHVSTLSPLTTFISLSSNQIQNGNILVPADSAQPAGIITRFV